MVCALAGGGGPVLPTVEFVTGVVRVASVRAPVVELQLGTPDDCTVTVHLDPSVAGYGLVAYGLAGEPALVGTVGDGPG